MSEKRFTYLTGAMGVLFYDGDEMIPYPKVCEILNKVDEQQATIKNLEKKLQICSAHLLSDECCLTDGQIRKIIKEMENE